MFDFCRNLKLFENINHKISIKATFLDFQGICEACSQDILHFIPSDGTVGCETEEFNEYMVSKPEPTKKRSEILSSLALKIEQNEREKVEFEYPCLHCPKRFQNKEELEKHFDSNHEIFQCNLCLLILADKVKLFRHVKVCGLADEDILRFPCSFCNRPFTRKDHLKNHMVLIHNEPRYKCKLCQLGFKIKKDFQEHKLICQSKMKKYKKLAITDC